MNSDTAAKTAFDALTLPQGDGTHRRRARYYALQSRIDAQQKDWPGAERSMRRSFDELRIEYAVEHPLCVVAAAKIAGYAHAQHNDDEARALLRPALPVIDRTLSTSSRDRRDAHTLAAALAMENVDSAKADARSVTGLR